MTNRLDSDRLPNWALTGLVAGAAGGLAEILWVTGYAAFAGESARAVAVAVTETVSSAWAAGAWPALMGVVIHMVLAIGLGLVLAWVLSRAGALSRSGPALFVVSTLALVAVWAINFFVVLPVVNPAFVTIIPLSISFASKLGFGLSAGLVFWAASERWTVSAWKEG